MPITSSDLKFKLSVKTGSAGNSTSQGNVNNSLGKYISTTEITDNTLHNLFDKITGDENAASTVDYRCIFVHNSHGSLTLEAAVIWISNQVSGGASIAIGLDPAGNKAIGDSSAQAAEVADELSAPAGVTFSAPTSKATGLSIGDLPAGQCRAVWVRRTAANSAAVDNDGATLSYAGDTGA